MKDEQEKLTAVDSVAEEMEHKARRTATLSGTDSRKADAMKAKYRVAVKRAQESEALIEELDGKVSRY